MITKFLIILKTINHRLTEKLNLNISKEEEDI